MHLPTPRRRRRYSSGWRQSQSSASSTSTGRTGCCTSACSTALCTPYTIATYAHVLLVLSAPPLPRSLCICVSYTPVSTALLKTARHCCHCAARAGGSGAVLRALHAPHRTLVLLGHGPAVCCANAVALPLPVERYARECQSAQSPPGVPATSRQSLLQEWLTRIAVVVRAASSLSLSLSLCLPCHPGGDQSSCWAFWLGGPLAVRPAPLHSPRDFRIERPDRPSLSLSQSLSRSASLSARAHSDLPLGGQLAPMPDACCCRVLLAAPAACLRAVRAACVALLAPTLTKYQMVISVSLSVSLSVCLSLSLSLSLSTAAAGFRWTRSSARFATLSQAKTSSTLALHLALKLTPCLPRLARQVHPLSLSLSLSLCLSVSLSLCLSVSLSLFLSL